MRSILAKSLLIDFLFTSICLSHGDNARDLVAAWGVGNDDDSTREQAQSDKSLFSIIETVISERYASRNVWRWANAYCIAALRKARPTCRTADTALL
jgi:hypothetical protein